MTAKLALGFREGNKDSKDCRDVDFILMIYNFDILNNSSENVFFFTIRTKLGDAFNERFSV